MVEARWERGRRSLALAAAAGLLLTAAGGGAALAQREMGDAVRGQALFAEKGCVSCHAVRGAGGRIGPDLGRTRAKSSFLEIAAGMWNHSVGMEAKLRELRMVRATFSDDELSDLIAFVFFLNYFDEPGDPRLGRVLFTEKHCIQCHRVEGQGGSIGPSLQSLPRGISPIRLAQSLWNHGPAMVRSMRSRGLDIPQFGGSEILDLFAYIRSQGEERVAREFQSAGDWQRGQRLFAAKGCSRCHELFADGGGIGPDLGSLELRGSVTQIAGRMWNHWSDMAEAMGMLEMRVPTFEGDELADLLAFVFISRYAGPEGDRERGAALFQDRGCSFCHGLDGEGTLGPPLRQTTPNAAREEIVELMWNHAPEMWVEMGLHQIPWPRFSATELADLIGFLQQGWNGEPGGEGGTRESSP